MTVKQLRSRLVFWLSIGWMLLGLAACNTPSGGSITSLNEFVGQATQQGIEARVLSPRNGEVIPVGIPITITSIHTATAGIDRVELRKSTSDTEFLIQSPRFRQSAFTAEFEWPPLEAGTHAFRIETYSRENDTPPDIQTFSIRVDDSVIPSVRVAGQEPAPRTPRDFGDPTACLNDAILVDETIPDGTTFNPGQTFTKQWRLQNAGTCNWGSGYKLQLISDRAFGATAFTLPAVPAGQATEVRLTMQAPREGGTYRSSWRLTDQAGRPFGNIFFVEFNVPGCEARGPIINSFRAADALLARGESTTLNWNVSGAEALSLSPGGAVALVGSQTVSPLETTVYTLSAFGDGCSQSQQITIRVQEQVPNCLGLAITRFEAVPPSISPGQQSTLQWQVNGATFLQLQPGAEMPPQAGSLAVYPRQSTTYRLEARNELCTRVAQVTVNVNPGGNAPAAPSNLRLVSRTATSFELAWQDNSTNEGSFVLRDQRSGRTLVTFLANTSQGTVAGLGCNTRYDLQLLAVGAGGESATSNLLSVTTAACN